MEHLNSNEDKLKMDVNYICNKSKQPPAKLQGIFSTFGIDKNKEFYYNYLDYKKNENKKSLSISKEQQLQQHKSHFHPYSSNSISIKNQFQNKENIQSCYSYITDNIIIIDNPVSKSQHYLKGINHITNKNNSNNSNYLKV
ncbi:hypothetical protein ACTA71_005765 [Dictyostelium dimigraforme]